MYRSLSQNEIDTLVLQNCSSTDWELIKVKKNFEPKYIKNVHFSGEIYLGVFEEKIKFENGITKHSGIYNAILYNCNIGNNVYINNINRHIANYEIADNCIIENVGNISITKETSFGNGIYVNVLNEVGGREVPIFDNLSSHLAYIFAMYRHNPKVTENLDKIVKKYTQNVTSKIGYIGKNTSILSTKSITNTKICAYTKIENCNKLHNGSINSNKNGIVKVGTGVIAENFILCSGVKVDNQSIIKNSFIGQNTVLDKQASIENSLFFANCFFSHGETCSSFCGPYTVSHHKATILIAGIYSFFNAGSGSNQSNHMYKLGPIHQGVVERGSKTSSNSYLLWPAKVGAFSIVMGRHYKNCDTSKFPFSYLIENNNESALIPGYNLRSIGTIRDAQKWPKRDLRKDDFILDFINFNLLSPYSIKKILEGKEIINNLLSTSGDDTKFYFYNNTRIDRKSMYRGLELYNIAIDKFLGNSIITKLEKNTFSSIEEIKEILKPYSKIGTGNWVDLSGLIAPKIKINELLENIENGNLNDNNSIHSYLRNLHKKYYKYEWNWVYDMIKQEYNLDLKHITISKIKQILKKWHTSVIALNDMLYKDAKKEFSLKNTISFGIDGDEKTKLEDFKQVRGKFKSHISAVAIKEHTNKKTKLYESILKKLSF